MISKINGRNYIEVLYDGEGKPLKENLKMEKESEVDEDSKRPRPIS